MYLASAGGSILRIGHGSIINAQQAATARLIYVAWGPFYVAGEAESLRRLWTSSNLTARMYWSLTSGYRTQPTTPYRIRTLRLSDGDAFGADQAERFDVCARAACLCAKISWAGWLCPDEKNHPDRLSTLPSEITIVGRSRWTLTRRLFLSFCPPSVTTLFPLSFSMADELEVRRGSSHPALRFFTMLTGTTRND